MVHRRELDGTEIVFGNQGALWGNAMTWWDHDTGTVWSQPLGEAIVGPRAGARLELLSSELTLWREWVAAHPDTLALDAPAGNLAGVARIPDLAIVVEFGSSVAVFPYQLVVSMGPANVVVGEVPVAVVADPGEPDRWRIFHRQVGDHLVELVSHDGRVVDRSTGSVWDVTRGVALEGPLSGESMARLPGFTSFLADTRTFWPDATVWAGS